MRVHIIEAASKNLAFVDAVREFSSMGVILRAQRDWEGTYSIQVLALDNDIISTDIADRYNVVTNLPLSEATGTMSEIVRKTVPNEVDTVQDLRLLVNTAMTDANGRWRSEFIHDVQSV